MSAVKGLYDGKKNQPLELITTEEPYIVVIPFIEPVSGSMRTKCSGKSEMRRMRTDGNFGRPSGVGRMIGRPRRS